MTDEEWEAPLDDEMEASIDRAMERTQNDAPPVVAVSVDFDRTRRLLVVTLGNGRRLSIPQEDLQGLADVNVDEAAEVEIDSFGMALWWEKLDLGFTIDGLIDGRTGNARWMERLREERRGNAAAALSRTA
jgi:Protein of unknown function (DUF2442)